MKNYPLVSDYKIAIIEAESFATLNFLEPCYNGNEPYFATGGPAVVFKMQDRNSLKYYAIKCFVKELSSRQHHFEKIAEYLQTIGKNPYFVNYQYHDKELWVNDADYPVLVMPWIEGTALSTHIAELCLEEDSEAIEVLANKFDKMALWLLEQDMAHGDLKPDNIIVTPDNRLMLVDYDGMFVPALAHCKSPELGTAEYRHPKRTNADFNKHLDDFPILVLSLSLHTLAADPALYTKAHGGDALLFKSEDYKNLLCFPHLSFFQNNSENSILYSRFSMLMYSVTQPVIELAGLKDLLVETANLVSEERDYVDISTTATEEDGRWVDEFGVVYSANRDKLITAPVDLAQYTVLQGTRVICDAAFNGCISLVNISIPYSVAKIGKGVFYKCTSITSIAIPDAVTAIGEYAFAECISLTSITTSDSVSAIDDYAFYNCSSLTSIAIPDTVTVIGECAFAKCSALTSITIPNSVTKICEYAFVRCISLTSITIPNSVTKIFNRVFFECGSITSITISNSVTKIGEYAFYDCRSLRSIILPDTVTEICLRAFEGCSSLTSIAIPDSVIEIGFSAFSGCSSLTSIAIPDSVTKIGERAFAKCSSLTSITIPDSVTKIFNRVFSECGSISSIAISNSVTKIGECTFYDCRSLRSIILPDTVTEICFRAFEGCHSLTSIIIPNSVTKIGECAFYECSSLTNIIIPDSVTKIGKSAFYKCNFTNNIKKELIARFGKHIFSEVIYEIYF